MKKLDLPEAISILISFTKYEDNSNLSDNERDAIKLVLDSHYELLKESQENYNKETLRLITDGEDCG
jgi:ribonucleotide reductase beta subunit family protein with ferritin-like domain